MICPACQLVADDASVEEEASGYRFLRCRSCEVVFAYPMPEVVGEWYRHHPMYVIRDHVAPGSLYWNHRQFLRDLPAPGGRLLDVGCGTGEFLAAARRDGYQAVGCDFDANAVRVARERLGLREVVVGEPACFRGEPFQVVTAFEVLEHSPAPGAFLEALGRLVAPGGFLAMSVPNRERRPAIRYAWDYPPHHLTRWSRSALADLLERHRFQVVRTAIGWQQGESLLHQVLQFGIVTRLLGNGRTGAPRPGAGPSLRGLRLASGAYGIKSTVIKALAPVVDLALGLAGASGMTIYVLARRADGH